MSIYKTAGVWSTFSSLYICDLVVNCPLQNINEWELLICDI